MEEKKKIKAGSVAVGICLFVIAILLVLIVVFFYNSNIEKNKLQEQISELEIILEEKGKNYTELEEEISKVKSNLINNILITRKGINTNGIYGFSVKNEIVDGQEKNTLVAISLYDNSEIPIMEFNSGAYDYVDKKIYFYNDKIYGVPELEYGFYKIDLSDELIISVEEIYLTERYSYLDHLEYYNGKLYYTASEAGLFSFDIENKSIEKIDEILNYCFDINNDTNILYYTNSEYKLCELNLITNEVNIIADKASVEYLAEDKLIYNGNTGYSEYDFKTQTHKKIIESWGGTIGKFNIVRENGNYIYINDKFKLIKETDSGKKQVLIKENGYNSLTILANNQILLESEGLYEGEETKTYIYDLEDNTIVPTTNNYRYSYMKKIQ